MVAPIEPKKLGVPIEIIESFVFPLGSKVQGQKILDKEIISILTKYGVSPKTWPSMSCRPIYDWMFISAEFVKKLQEQNYLIAFLQMKALHSQHPSRFLNFLKNRHVDYGAKACQGVQ